MNNIGTLTILLLCLPAIALAQAENQIWGSNPDRGDAVANDPEWKQMSPDKLCHPSKRAEHHKIIAASIYLGGSSRAIDMTISQQADLCWVLNNWTGSINVVDIARRRLVGSITGLEAPLAIHYLPQAKRLLVLDRSRENSKNKLVLIDPRGQADRKVIPVGSLSTYRVCSTVVSRDESTLWVAEPSGESSRTGAVPSYLYEIDIESGSCTQRGASVPRRQTGHMLDIGPSIFCLMDRDGRLLVSGLESGHISRYNKKTAAFEPLVTLKSRPHRIFGDGKTDRVYAALKGGEVAYFDPYKQTKPVYLAAGGAISGVRCMGKAEKVVFADPQTHALRTYQLPAGRKPATINLPGGEADGPVGIDRLGFHEKSQTLVAIVREGYGLAFYDLRKRVGTFLDVQGGWSIRVPPGSTRAFVCNRRSANLSVVDLATDRLLGTIPVQGQPADIRFRPDGKQGVVFDIKGNAIGVLDVAALQILPNDGREIPDDLVAAGPRSLALSKEGGDWVKVPGWTGVEKSIVINNDKGRSYWRLFASSLTSVVLSPDERWAYVLCENNPNGSVLIKVPVRSRDMERQLSGGK